MPSPDRVPAARVRPAAAADLPAAARVYLLADDEADLRLHGRSLRQPPPPGSTDEAETVADLAALRAESPEWVWVAEAGADSEIVGVAALAVRGRHWHLHYLFVRPEWQGRGIGRALLERAHAVGIAAGCAAFSVHASSDPAALGRYLALGLALQPPTLDLRAAPAAFRPPGSPWDDGLLVQPLAPDGVPDPALSETVGDLDRVVRGAARPGDLARWLAERSAGALLTDRERGTPAGYYLVGAVGRGGRIGPVAALDEARFAAVLARALAAAAPLARPDRSWAALVPGANRAALPPLLAAGFRPRGLTPFLASAPVGRFDRYLFHDEDYL